MIKKITFMSFLLIAPFARIHATESTQEVVTVEQGEQVCSPCDDAVVAPASALTFKAVFQQEGVEALCHESVVAVDGAFSYTFGDFVFSGTVVRSEDGENTVVVSYILTFVPTGQSDQGSETIPFGAESVLTISETNTSADDEGNEITTSKVIATLGFVVTQE